MEKPSTPMPQELDSAFRRVHDRLEGRTIQHRVPVWVHAALLGVGLTLATGCSGKQADSGPPADDISAAMQPEKPATVPVADPPMLAVADPPSIVPDVAAPATMDPGPGTADGPSKNVPPAMTDGRVVTAGMMDSGPSGAYGAPPMRGGKDSLDQLIDGPVDPGTSGAYGAPMAAGSLQVNTRPDYPADVPLHAHRIISTFFRAMETCLEAAHTKSPLPAGQATIQVSFESGRLEKAAVIGNPPAADVVRSCAAQSLGRAKAAAPPRLSAEEKLFGKSWTVRVIWK